MKAAYDSFMKNNNVSADMTQEQYTKLWKIYHDMALRDKLDNQGYNAFMEIMKNTDLYKMDDEQIQTALGYIESSKKLTTTGIIDDVLSNVKTEMDIELAW